VRTPGLNSGRQAVGGENYGNSAAMNVRAPAFAFALEEHAIGPVYPEMTYGQRPAPIQQQSQRASQAWKYPLRP
jgi:hypothetical protein